MIDRGARRRLAQELRHFAAGLTTNDQFENRLLDLRSSDRVVSAIIHYSWFLYDDLREYKCRGEDELPANIRGDICRWILFLKSDLEYQWPWPKPIDSLHAFFGLITLGLWTALIRLSRGPSSRAFGDEEVWPFRRSDDLNRTRAFEHGVARRGLG
jgi:hypothetical protein